MHVELLPKRIVLPKILEWYIRDWGRDTAELLDKLKPLLSAAKAQQLNELLKARENKKTIEFSGYDWTFQYKVLNDSVSPTSSLRAGR